MNLRTKDFTSIILFSKLKGMYRNYSSFSKVAFILVMRYRFRHASWFFIFIFYYLNRSAHQWWGPLDDQINFPSIGITQMYSSDHMRLHVHQLKDKDHLNDNERVEKTGEMREMNLNMKFPPGTSNSSLFLSF